MLSLVHGVLIVFERFKGFKDGRDDLQDDPRSGRPPTSRNADTVANVREMVTRDRACALRMMADELTPIRRRLVKTSMKIYGRGRCVQSLSHRDSRTSRSSGDSHHANISSRIVKTIPVSRNVFKWVKLTLSRNKTIFYFLVFLFFYQS
jgi:hypothetical protein